MEEEIIKFIDEVKISPFNSKKTLLKQQKSIFKTSDGKNIVTRFMQHLSSRFVFADTSNIFTFFEYTNSVDEIKKRQNFFRTLPKYSNNCLKNIHNEKSKWRIPYTLIAVTENEQTFLELKNRGCPTKLILSDNDISSLEQYDLVYAIECDEYSRALEQLDNIFFTSEIEDIYLERYLIELSKWTGIINTLFKEQEIPAKMQELVKTVNNLSSLLGKDVNEKIDLNKINKAVENINHSVERNLNDLTISGAQIINLMQKGSLPPQINTLITEEISKSGIPAHFFKRQLPVQVDEEEVEKALRKQTANSSTRFAKQLLKEKNTLLQIPSLLKKLENYLLYLDFAGGIQIASPQEKQFPQIGEELQIQDAENKLIDNPQKISFNLTKDTPCSILTGANSGGKTTLLEHIIQITIEVQIGLPLNNLVKMPLFSEIYYFAKNKGSASKGAFETLLTELATIKPGKQTLILADEVEAVTEPGVAGKIMKATIEYFVPQGCFMILATHLGKELQQDLPKGARIDGIEATGLDEEFNLLVNHNPVLGRLARSTPELIVEKMAKSNDNSYLSHLYSMLKKES